MLVNPMISEETADSGKLKAFDGKAALNTTLWRGLPLITAQMMKITVQTVLTTCRLP